VLWLLELEGAGANEIISVGIVVPSPELAGYPPGILNVSGTLVLFEDALLECLEGSRVMGIIIFTYVILIHVTFAQSNQSCHTTVFYTAYLGESSTPRLNLQPTSLYTSEVCSRRSSRHSNRASSKRTRVPKTYKIPGGYPASHLQCIMHSDGSGDTSHTIINDATLL